MQSNLEARLRLSLQGGGADNKAADIEGYIESNRKGHNRKAHLDPPDQGEGADDHRDGETHAQEGHHRQRVLAADPGVREYHHRRNHIVHTPEDGNEQRTDDDCSGEHLPHGSIIT